MSPNGASASGRRRPATLALPRGRAGETGGRRGAAEGGAARPARGPSVPGSAGRPLRGRPEGPGARETPRVFVNFATKPHALQLEDEESPPSSVPQTGKRSVGATAVLPESNWTQPRGARPAGGVLRAPRSRLTHGSQEGVVAGWTGGLPGPPRLLRTRLGAEGPARDPRSVGPRSD